VTMGVLATALGYLAANPDRVDWIVSLLKEPSMFKISSGSEKAAGLIGLVIGTYRLFLPPPQLEKDTPAFKTALKCWYPLVFAATPTPRAVKRYLNRVRYLAMCDRGSDRSPRRQVSPARRRIPGTGPMPEDVLVAWAALQHSGVDVRDGHSRLRELASPPLNGTPSPSWELLTQWQPRFDQLAKGVHVN
jgi:hypothetical protein